MYQYTLRYQQKFVQSLLSGLDWTGLASDPLSRTGLDQDHRLRDLDWTGLFQMNPLHTLAGGCLFGKYFLKYSSERCLRCSYVRFIRITSLEMSNHLS